jgi:hypothetical protein
VTRIEATVADRTMVCTLRFMTDTE